MTEILESAPSACVSGSSKRAEVRARRPEMSASAATARPGSIDPASARLQLDLRSCQLLARRQRRDPPPLGHSLSSLLAARDARLPSALRNPLSRLEARDTAHARSAAQCTLRRPVSVRQVYPPWPFTIRRMAGPRLPMWPWSGCREWPAPAPGLHRAHGRSGYRRCEGDMRSPSRGVRLAPRALLTTRGA